MDGVLIIDKPAGITSHDVVSRVRRILGTRRVGHTGTLDPFATGVMVVLVGRATRLAQFLDKDDKEYEATIKFGYETDTGDRTGTRSAEYEMRNSEFAALLDQTDWDPIFDRFRGEIEQLPPMYSAKKIDGKKLYESARKGIDVERKPVRVSISKLDMVDAETAADERRIAVACSAGTYIRTLAQDIGRVLGTGAHLTELRRTRAGRFDLSQSITLDVLAAKETPGDAFLPMKVAVEHLPRFVLPPDRVDKTRNGMSTRLYDAVFEDGSLQQMVTELGELIAIGVYDSSQNSIRPKVVLV
ncbi:MAG TPA: tRNA pseudouridine(55) synthase TruB [Pyrinomonadaceae bacterium]|jgi:tRNA pseudouridine55 synthase|nr:tRNA pseudouridine(55) synthase TruB [Pyrinomonadaceae bacterium]